MDNKDKINFLKKIHGDVSSKRLNRQSGVLTSYIEKFGVENGCIIYKDMIAESKEKTSDMVNSLLREAAMYRLSNAKYRELDQKLNELISEGSKGTNEFNSILAKINKLGQTLTEEFVAQKTKDADAN